MRKRLLNNFAIPLAALLCLFLMTGYAQQTGTAAKKEYTFHGKIEKVDAKEKTLTVNGEKVEGWMDSMSMTYAVDKEDVIKNLKVGDQITAKVYEGDYKVLHDVKVVPATPPKK